MNKKRLIARVRKKYQAQLSDLDERTRRQWAATEAAAIGRGGVTIAAPNIKYNWPGICGCRYLPVRCLDIEKRNLSQAACH
jgi:hypothetical protein